MPSMIDACLQIPRQRVSLGLLPTPLHLFKPPNVPNNIEMFIKRARLHTLFDYDYVVKPHSFGVGDYINISHQRRGQHLWRRRRSDGHAGEYRSQKAVLQSCVILCCLFVRSACLIRCGDGIVELLCRLLCNITIIQLVHS